MLKCELTLNSLHISCHSDLRHFILFFPLFSLFISHKLLLICLPADLNLKRVWRLVGSSEVWPFFFFLRTNEKEIEVGEREKC